MDTSEKQIIGENAKYVSDNIPQETKDGLRAHLKPGYAMSDGTHYATGKDYTELMRNLPNTVAVRSATTRSLDWKPFSQPAA